MTDEKIDFRSLKKNVYLTGSTSLLSDVSSEMIYPVLPFFLKALLGAAAPAY